MRNLSFVVLLSLGACGLPESPAPRAATPPVAHPAVAVANPLDAEILEIAKGYQAWGRVDDEFRWAPWLCRMPNPSHARMSAAPDAAGHGQKAYYIFAKEREAYVAAGSTAQPTGQVLVKQSWKTEVCEAPKREHRESDAGGTFSSTLTKEGTTYRASTFAGLFLMIKRGKATADTDAGWVYATLASDLKTVTAAGRIASCIGCHEKAENDRVFGVPK
jgi:hypothetical protein